MVRYVIANRRAGKFHETEKRAARAALDRSVAFVANDIGVIGDNAPAQDTDRRVMIVDADPMTVAAMAAHPEVLVEPEILHWPAMKRPTDFIQATPIALDAPVPSGTATVAIQVTGSGQPLEGAEAVLFLRGPGGVERRLEQSTDAGGSANFAFDPAFRPSALVVAPAGGHWTMVVRAPGANVDVECHPLPATGPLGWWHRVLGQTTFDSAAGTSIRVGVVDTGVGVHPNLDHALDVGAFIDAAHLPPPAGQDVDSHGTHVCGTIGARPAADGQFAGIAPGVNLLSARVFPPDDGANQGDIANAIDELSRTHRVDLINLSLGASERSEIERDAIRDALERGTLCVCAAANSSGPVEFPAAFEESVAVSALGLLGFAPSGTLSETRLPQESARFGSEDLYLANFSCFGPELACAGPGVGVIATVPERFGLAAPYGVMDGTSMASPAVCAALAVLLARSPAYGALPRDETRAHLAREILRQSCREVGLAAVFQGRGVPKV
jgi:subtilisin family serine protease